MNPRDLAIYRKTDGTKELVLDCFPKEDLTLLCHAKQPALGCLWHGAYAVTGERGLLAYTDELSNDRFSIIMATQYNYLERCWWNQAHLETPCDWEALASTIPANALEGLGYRRYYCAWRTGKLLHAFGMLFPFDPSQPHIISDSLCDNFLILQNRNEFMKTRYAQAFLVSEFFKADLGLYPSKTVKEI